MTNLERSHPQTPRLALIGADGEIGVALARLLTAADRRFRVLTADPARARTSLGSHADAVDAELADPFSVEAALVGVERVLVASDAPHLEPYAIAAARRAGVRRVVLCSAIGQGGRAAPEHGAAEDALLSSGMEWTLLRAAPSMQSLAEMIELTSRGAAIRLPLGDAAVSWVDCRDVAAVALHALLEDEHGGQTYVITGPRAWTGADLAATFAHALGRPLRYLPIAPERATAELRGAGLSAPRARAIVERCERLRAGDAGLVTDVVQRIAHIEPRTLPHFAARHAWAIDGHAAPSA